VLEFFHGRPSASALLHARAKGILAFAMDLEKAPTPALPGSTSLILITIGTPRRAFEVAYPARKWVVESPGLRCYDESERHVHIDLLRLSVSRDTAWLHIAGNGPRADEALSILLGEEDREVRTLLARLCEEATAVPELQKLLPADQNAAHALNFLKAWERAELMVDARRKGIQEGQREGRREGRQEGAIVGERRALLRLLSRRHGTPSGELLEFIHKLQSLDALETLIDVAADGSAEAVLEAARRLAEAP
jgi:hypothetical protein